MTHTRSSAVRKSDTQRATNMIQNRQPRLSARALGMESEDVEGSESDTEDAIERLRVRGVSSACESLDDIARDISRALCAMEREWGLREVDQS